MTELAYLSADDVRTALPMRAAVDAMRLAFSDDRDAPPRVALGVSLFMPGRVGDHTAVKVVSSVPGNPAGLVAVFGPTTTVYKSCGAAGMDVAAAVTALQNARR